MQDYLMLHADEKEHFAFLIMESLGFGVILIDENDHRIVYANNAALRMSGHDISAILNSVCHELVCPAEKGKCPISDLKQDVDNSERKLVCADGRLLPIIKTVIPLVLGNRRYLLESFIDNLARKNLEEALIRKNQELMEAVQTIKQTQAQLIQQEKLAGIGQLAAGVAHEINNPLGFIISNLDTLTGYAEKLERFVLMQEALLEELVRSERNNNAKAAYLEMRERKRSLDIDFVLNDIGDLIRETLDGAERVKNIVRDLKGFARISEEQRLADINEGLESTLQIMWNELKYKVVLEKKYGEIPLTMCNLGQLNQVFVNILSNAAAAISEQGEIRISTWADEKDIFIEFADNGCGMTPEEIQKIFEPFYTTKDIEAGSGLGLSVSREIIKKHGGNISVKSEPGKGSIFKVVIPIVTD